MGYRHHQTTWDIPNVGKGENPLEMGTLRFRFLLCNAKLRNPSLPLDDPLLVHRPSADSHLGLSAPLKAAQIDTDENH